MRQAESDYWDEQARDKLGKGFKENVWKRCAVVARVLARIPVHVRVLEIGVGQAITAGAVKLATVGNLRYTGTDVSPLYCKAAKKRFHLNVVNTDILALPDGPFDMIWCFDSLEHVRPEDRADGYREISRVLASPGLIMINAPSMDNASGHATEFDHHYDERDVLELSAACQTEVRNWQPYTLAEIKRSYLWVELAR